MAYTDLISLFELDRDALESLDVLDIMPAAEGAIADVTRRIESYLDRELIVRKHTQAVTRWEWVANQYEANDVVDRTMLTFADHWPVLEAVTTGLEVGPKADRLKIDTDDAEAGTYTYFAGYKRADQTLSGLQDESDLSNLSVTPDDLPTDIRRVAVRLTLHELGVIDEQLLGKRRIEASGPVSVTVDAEDPGFERRELRKLDVHKRRV